MTREHEPMTVRQRIHVVLTMLVYVPLAVIGFLVIAVVLDYGDDALFCVKSPLYCARALGGDVWKWLLT